VSRMGERARLLESQARCVQRRRATTSRLFPDSTQNIVLGPQDTPTSLSLSLTLPYSPTLYILLIILLISNNAFCRGFIKSGPCTLIQFQSHLSLIRGPTGTDTDTRTFLSLFYSTLTVSDAGHLFIHYVCYRRRYVPLYIHTHTTEILTKIVQCTRRLPLLVT
jgi:hypothetical protein